MNRDSVHSVLCTLESRLANPRPWIALGIDRDAEVAEACEAYLVLKRRLLSDFMPTGPALESRIVATLTLLRARLDQFCRTNAATCA